MKVSELIVLLQKCEQDVDVRFDYQYDDYGVFVNVEHVSQTTEIVAAGNQYTYVLLRG